MKTPPCEEHSIAIEKLKSQNDFYLQGINDIKKYIERLEIKIDNLSTNYVSFKELTIYKENLNDRVVRIEKNLSRATWLILSGVIMAVLGVVISNPL